ncbi:hypothetical protein BpHYR1_030018 [Brachionus plicatilis]|uniref:Uncharacterized protein n=1 Tax=Brachionus plicatilis TaxID=10195 RepID=A0A3M7QUU9_BRAPC|nr:hypothetical protein BpHYR1_030018 [Brachionus plicatilis]
MISVGRTVQSDGRLGRTDGRSPLFGRSVTVCWTAPVSILIDFFKLCHYMINFFIKDKLLESFGIISKIDS